ncbi:MAG: hypothetical protein Q8Q76_09920 [Methylotenera sp.]|nr:hypothetical protein [Methylotenera sp.]
MIDEKRGASQIISIILCASLNLILLGLLVFFWIAVFNVGMPEGLGGGKFLVFFHVAVFVGLYKVNKKHFKYINKKE